MGREFWMMIMMMFELANKTTKVGGIISDAAFFN